MIVPLEDAYAYIEDGESVTKKTPRMNVSLKHDCDALRSCNLSVKLALATWSSTHIDQDSVTARAKTLPAHLLLTQNMKCCVHM